MQKIPLKLAKTGMKLGKPVVNDRGMTLCGSGTALTEEIIERLVRMEVKKITVEGHPVNTGEPEKSLEQRFEELDQRFRKVQNDPLMSKIKAVMVQVMKEQAEE